MVNFVRNYQNKEPDLKSGSSAYLQDRIGVR